MKLSRAIDLGRSLRKVFGDNPGSEGQVRADQDRQTRTAETILARFFGANENHRRELVLLADEVGLGKTYVALAVAATILDAIRQGEAPAGLPANRPVVLVLTPNNEALYNKWLREADGFRHDCEREGERLDWLRVERPPTESSKSGNIIHMTAKIRQATRSQPVLLIAKLGALGAALHDRDVWRRRALACVFEACGVRTDDRPWCCRQVVDSGSKAVVPELLDLRKSNCLWTDTDCFSQDMHQAYQRALGDSSLRTQLAKALDDRNGPKLADLMDDLTRAALVGDWPRLPLVIIDEVHGLKNQQTQARRHVEHRLGGRACRVLGLSATPFQLRHDELISVLGLSSLASLSGERAILLEKAVERLTEAMKGARDAGDLFHRRWRALRPRDRDPIHAAWEALSDWKGGEHAEQIGRVRPPRVAHALEAACGLEACNHRLQDELHPFVIRHRRPRNYREHFVGKAALPGGTGRPHFAWAPGMDVGGDAELTHYLMMRAVALAKEEKGLPGLGAELTGSYRHLIQTSAVWKRLAQAKNPLLPQYRTLLEDRLPIPQADGEHCKIKTTVARALDFFRRGQKTLIFCVYTKTAEAIRNELTKVIDRHLGDVRDRVFGGETAFENFRKRFFNRREPLYSLIQDHPLLGKLRGGEVGIPGHLRMGIKQLREVAKILVERGEPPETDKPDRRLILAAVEHVAFLSWRDRADGREWLLRALGNCFELVERMASDVWLDGREPLSRRPKAGRSTAVAAPEANDTAALVSPDEDEEEQALQHIEAGREEASVDGWVERLCGDALGDMVAPYFREDATKRTKLQLPLLAAHHGDLMAQLDVTTRAAAGGVFRRILMAEEFVLRYLADVPREQAERWADYFADRYIKPLDGHLESLRDRVTAYLETLARAGENGSLLAGYRAAAENRHVVQLVQGGTANRDHFFLGFNTPYRPEILISTSVGQEGIDLHRECRHIIHHDLCWNPATIEQRTGRVDRIGSKVERERAGAENDGGPTLEVAVPYLAATYDERMFEELYGRAQLFEVTLGGDVRVDGRIETEDGSEERDRRMREGIGTEDEDLGEEAETGMVDLPEDMVERLRVDLSEWKP